MKKKISILFLTFIILGIMNSTLANELRKPLASLNQALALDYALNGTKIEDISTGSDLILLLKKYFNLRPIAYGYNEQLNFQSLDGTIYSIKKFSKGCSYVNLDNPMNSSCVIEIDINGTEAPNKLNEDKFYVVLDKNTKEFLPSSAAKKLYY